MVDEEFNTNVSLKVWNTQNSWKRTFMVFSEKKRIQSKSSRAEQIGAAELISGRLQLRGLGGLRRIRGLHVITCTHDHGITYIKRTTNPPIIIIEKSLFSKNWEYNSP
ncbi:hypothetical protein AMTR_s00041p00147750 [Amborella trichopoda]|uniref:Uncharacterized protein n=1 Tax=Amborella trichopoda TaxID=13333 RepID=W1PTL2_AMBTC|nr:hypothetical protein AMTR_s00041p00147750 [Amborella trichopoda]